MRPLLPALLCLASLAMAAEKPDLQVVDLSGQKERHVVVAAGTEKTYQGHPTTLLLPNSQTIFCAWTLGHGGRDDGRRRLHAGGRHARRLL